MDTNPINNTVYDSQASDDSDTASASNHQEPLGQGQDISSNNANDNNDEGDINPVDGVTLAELVRQAKSGPVDKIVKPCGTGG